MLSIYYCILTTHILLALFLKHSILNTLESKLLSFWKYNDPYIQFFELFNQAQLYQFGKKQLINKGRDPFLTVYYDLNIRPSINSLKNTLKRGGGVVLEEF